MWLFKELLAKLNRIWPPPAPRSLASISGKFTPSGTKFVSRSNPFCSPFPAKNSGSPLKRSGKSYWVLKTNSGSPYVFNTGGALVTATYRAGSDPDRLKCWWTVFSGIANSAPGPHSNSTSCPAKFLTVVFPWPDKIITVSSNS